VCAGPLFGELGLSPDEVTDARVAAWQAVARQLCAQLCIDAAPAALTPEQAARVYRYYLPVYLWVAARLDAHRTDTDWRASPSAETTPAPAPSSSSLPPPSPLIIGLSAPQVTCT
jgi:D-glycerate 3-kinase